MDKIDMLEQSVYQHFAGEVMRIMMKYEIDSLEKLDMCLREQRVWGYVSG